MEFEQAGCDRTNDPVVITVVREWLQELEPVLGPALFDAPSEDCVVEGVLCREMAEDECFGNAGGSGDFLRRGSREPLS